MVQPLARSPQAARTFVLSGGLTRAVDRLERFITPAAIQAWTPSGWPLDQSPLIHSLLSRTRQEAERRRYQIAIRWYETAERTALASAPTIREMRRRRREAEMAEDEPLIAEAKKVRTGRQRAAVVRTKQIADWQTRILAAHTKLLRRRQELGRAHRRWSLR